MGNKIDTPKLKQYVLDIANNIETNDKFIKTEFKHLFEIIQISGTDIKNNTEFQKSFKQCLLELNENLIMNFAKNLVDYLNIQVFENINNLKTSLEIVLLIIETIYEKCKNFREILIFSINSVLEKFKEYSFEKEDDIKEMIKTTFPFNLLLFSIDLNTNEELYNRQNFFKTENEKTEIMYINNKIIFNIVYYQKNNDLTAKNYIEFFDPFKIFLCSEVIFAKTKLIKFLENLFKQSIGSFTNLISNTKYALPEQEDNLNVSFYLLLWFCYDINKFFFNKVNNNENVEFYFENDYNEKIYKFITKFLFPINLSNSNNKPGNHFMQIITNYNKIYNEYINTIFIYNSEIFKNFLFNFFINYDKLTYSFKVNTKILITYYFENNQVKIIF